MVQLLQHKLPGFVESFALGALGWGWLALTQRCRARPSLLRCCRCGLPTHAALLHSPPLSCSHVAVRTPQVGPARPFLRLARSLHAYMRHFHCPCWKSASKCAFVHNAPLPRSMPPMAA